MGFRHCERRHNLLVLAKLGEDASQHLLAVTAWRPLLIGLYCGEIQHDEPSSHLR